MVFAAPHHLTWKDSFLCGWKIFPGFWRCEMRDVPQNSRSLSGGLFYLSNFYFATTLTTKSMRNEPSDGDSRVQMSSPLLLLSSTLLPLTLAAPLVLVHLASSDDFVHLLQKSQLTNPAGNKSRRVFCWVHELDWFMEEYESERLQGLG